MGYILRLILFFIVFSWIIKIARRLIINRIYKKHFNQQNNPFNRQQPEPEKRAPETQEERILDFQRKKFEATDIEDADFEEIK